MGVAGKPVQVRNPDAADVDGGRPVWQASRSSRSTPWPRPVEIVSHTPCAVAHGDVEIWPLVQKP